MESYTKEELSKLPFMNEELDLEARVEDLLSKLNLKEKIKLSSGKLWMATRKIKRLGIPKFKMTDGPHGAGMHSSYRSNIYYPTSICMGATWNVDVAEKFGQAYGEEVRARKRHMILGPALNIHRSPLCGRTFEYITEDPYLNKKLASQITKGIQSEKVSACIKHYVANNQEKHRMTINAIVSERALQEIYLPGFKECVTKADAWSAMACYNKLNGYHGCEHVGILRETLMKEWGFRGFVVSDWFAAAKTTSPEACITAGLSLEMPIPLKYKMKDVMKAYEANNFKIEDLDENTRRLLRVMFLVGRFDKDQKIPKIKGRIKQIKASREVAEEGITLLKNENNILPLDIEKIKSIAVIGPNANKKHSHIFKGGSSGVSPPYEITPKKGLKNKCKGKVEITSKPSESELTIIVAGLDHSTHQDAEGFDREQLELPQKQIDLINTTAKENKNVIVVLINGSPVAMDGWIENVSAVVEAWYPGLEGGNVIADILFGDINPSGKLPTTFPKKLSDSPAHKSERTWPGESEVYYDEGIYVGYRHFDKEEIKPLFPFGFGLSYTTFEYSNLVLDKNSISGDNALGVSVSIKNTGKVVGKEIVQLYISDLESSVDRPPKELKGFKKVEIKPGEIINVDFSILKEDLSFYSDKENKWIVEPGKFKVLVGSSSRDIKLEKEFSYN